MAGAEAEAPEMRLVYARTLKSLAERDPDIVVLEADLMRSNGTGLFREAFPERAFNVGVAEANMVGIAAGLSATGKIPFAATFSCFAARRAYDQFFISANYARQNVKLVGTDPGIAALYNGGTHMSFEDIGLMRNIPHLTIFEPCDAISLSGLLVQSAYRRGCTYMRLYRWAVPAVYGKAEPFELGRGKVLRDGGDVTLIALGALLVPEALQAAALLQEERIAARVVDMHTVKPIDAELVLDCARKTGAIVTCENHQVLNGLGSAVAEVLGEHRPTLLKRVGVEDEFGEVGPLEYLQQRYGLTAANITRQAKELLKRRDA
jgi:transketolase